jgi:hypothetical protein
MREVLGVVAAVVVGGEVVVEEERVVVVEAEGWVEMVREEVGRVQACRQVSHTAAGHFFL